VAELLVDKVVQRTTKAAAELEKRLKEIEKNMPPKPA